MIEDMQLKDYSESTQSLYVNAVRQLCEHFDKVPGKITFCTAKTLKNGAAAPALSPCAASNFSIKIPLSAPGQRCCLSAPRVKRSFRSCSAVIKFLSF
jgi:hypothetical protein